MLNIALLIKKYSVPTIFGIVGALVLGIGIKTGQSGQYIFASLLILLSALLSFLNISGIISNKVTKVIGIGSLVLSGIAIYITTKSVSDTVDHNNDYEKIKIISIRNLMDVQTAQRKYHEKYEVYAHNWDELIHFIETDSIEKVTQRGSVPSRRITEQERDYLIGLKKSLKDPSQVKYSRGDAIDQNMTPTEAYWLSKSEICPDDLVNFNIDTFNVSTIESLFTKNTSYINERKENNFGAFNVRNLKYVPYSSKKVWAFDSAIVVKRSSTNMIEPLITFAYGERVLSTKEKLSGTYESRDTLKYPNVTKQDFIKRCSPSEIEEALSKNKVMSINKLQIFGKEGKNNAIEMIQIATDSTIMITEIKDTLYTFRLEGHLPISKLEGTTVKEVMSLGNITKESHEGSWEDENTKQTLQLPRKEVILNRRKN